MRYFISLDVESEEVRENLVNFTENIKRLGDTNTVKPENYHITLLFLGEKDGEELDEVKRSFRSASSEINTDKFECEISGLGVFPHINFIKVVWARAKPGDKINELHMNYRSSFTAENEDDFVPHVTLERVKNISGSEKRELQKEIESHPADFGCFTVENVRLKESELKDDGPVYRDVEVYSL